MNEDLATIGQPIADALIPGWRVEWLWCAQAELDEIIPGAMAICSTTPTRSMAVVRVLTPWPESESLAETLWHEVTHAAWSPLTSLIPASDGATMVEEQIVERFGVLLSKLPQGLARVVSKAIRQCATPRAMARISALAPRARSGENMDPNLMKKALEVIAAGDAAGALELLSAIVATAAGAPVDAGPEPTPEPAPAAPAGAAPAPGGEPAKDDAPMARANARALSASASLVKSAIRARVHEVRAVDGFTISPAVEAKIAACESIEAAESMLALVRDTIASNGGEGGARARSGAKPPGSKPGPLEGMSARDRATYAGLATSNPKAADAFAEECARVKARAPKGGAK